MYFKPVFRALDKTGGGGGWVKWSDDFAGRGHVPLVAPWAFKPCWALYIVELGIVDLEVGMQNSRALDRGELYPVAE